MILVINICKEKLHHFEFVKPIEDILRKNKINHYTKHYFDINNKDLEDCEKIIICGTSLYDHGFVKDIGYFKWIRDFNKPILGICGGMQVIGLIFGSKLKRKTEIGFYKENFIKEFLGLFGKQEVYHLHNNYIVFKKLKKLEIFNSGKIPQAIKHKEKDIYGVLFHPEVRQKEMIKDFCSM